jgi:hypothetical protein
MLLFTADIIVYARRLRPPALMLCKPPRYNNNNNTMHSLRQHPLSLTLPPRTGTHYAHQSSRRTLRSLNLLALSISISSFSLRAALTSPPASLSSMRLPSQSIPIQSRPSNAVASSGSLIIFYIICCFPLLPTRSRSNQMLLLFSIPQRGASQAPRCSAQAGRVRLLVSRPEPTRDYKIING